MGFGLLVAVVVSQATSVQAFIASVESHYRGLGTFSMPVSITVTPSSLDPRSKVTQRTGELTVQNPAMMAYVSDDGLNQVAIDGRRFRTITHASARAPSLFEAFDLQNARITDRLWSYVARILTGPASLNTVTRFMGPTQFPATPVGLVGTSLVQGTVWRTLRLEVDPTTLEVTQFTLRSSDGTTTDLTFGPARRVPAVPPSAFVLSPP